MDDGELEVVELSKASADHLLVILATEEVSQDEGEPGEDTVAMDSTDSSKVTCYS